MSLKTEGGSAAVSESAPVESSPAQSESKSNYSVTDPGYSDEAESEVTLESLRAENETKPSSTEDDASEVETDSTEETTEESPVETAESNDISDELLDRATELGYTLDEIKGFRSEKSLEKEISRVETLQKRLQERQGKKPTAEPDPVDDPEPKWDEMIQAGHDPDNVAIQKQLWQRATNAEAMVKQVFQAEQDRALTAQSERFDDTLNKLEGYAKILGSGRKGEIEKASPDHAANRQTVFTTMQILKRGFEEAGKPVPSEEKLIKAAAMASFPDHTEQTVREKLKADIKKAGSQALSRPHSTGAKPLSGEPRALALEADYWKNPK